MTQPGQDGMALLPEDAAEAGVGMVRLSVDAMDRLTAGADGAAAPDCLSRVGRAVREIEQDRGVAAWRGLLAFCLLVDAWAVDVRLTIRSVTGGDRKSVV